QSLLEFNSKVNFLVLGSGEPEIEEALKRMPSRFKKNVNVYIGYDEALSHRIYAGADFLLMPSRVEPCGLNQLYAMKYGTIPIVRSTGGLKDSVIDAAEPEGYGICFPELDVDSIVASITRAVDLYANTSNVRLLRKRMMLLDFSWNRSANQYID